MLEHAECMHARGQKQTAYRNKYSSNLMRLGWHQIRSNNSCTYLLFRWWHNFRAKNVIINTWLIGNNTPETVTSLLRKQTIQQCAIQQRNEYILCSRITANQAVLYLGIERPKASRSCFSWDTWTTLFQKQLMSFPIQVVEVLEGREYLKIRERMLHGTQNGNYLTMCESLLSKLGKNVTSRGFQRWF